MPVRSLPSSVLKWPDREAVLDAARRWAATQAAAHPELLAIGCYGSYARGDWGVGSDLDLVVIVGRCDEPFERRVGAAFVSGLAPSVPHGGPLRMLLECTDLRTT